MESVTGAFLGEVVEVHMAHAACQLPLNGFSILDRKVRVAEVDNQVDAAAVQLVVDIRQSTQLACGD